MKLCREGKKISNLNYNPALLTARLAALKRKLARVVEKQGAEHPYAVLLWRRVRELEAEIRREG